MQFLGAIKKVASLGAFIQNAKVAEKSNRFGRHLNGVVVGPFEEEEEGTSISSDVVKMKGEDPATPGPLP